MITNLKLINYNYATLFLCAIHFDGTCSKFITFLHHVDVEGKQELKVNFGDKLIMINVGGLH